ncbi:MAG: cupredoxin domain-containing protein [Solirubrobacteraceae bacterium]
MATAIAAVLLAGGGGRSGGGAPSSSGGTSAQVRSGTVTIEIKNFAYHPASVVVAAGTRVKVINEDDAEHTATSNAEGAFETGALQKGQSASFTLRKPGAYPYHCAFHAFMHSTIKVVAR